MRRWMKAIKCIQACWKERDSVAYRVQMYAEAEIDGEEVARLIRQGLGVSPEQIRKWQKEEPAKSED